MKYIKIILIIELIFIIFNCGRLYGAIEVKEIRKELINNLYIELDSEKEKSYQLKLENQKLNTILDNYTIQERKSE